MARVVLRLSGRRIESRNKSKDVVDKNINEKASHDGQINRGFVAQNRFRQTQKDFQQRLQRGPAEKKIRQGQALLVDFPPRLLHTSDMATIKDSTKCQRQHVIGVLLEARE